MKPEIDVTEGVPADFEAGFHLDGEAGVKEALRIIGLNARPPAEFVRQRSAALARAWEAKCFSDAQEATRDTIQKTRLELEEKTSEERKFATVGMPSPAGLQERIVLLEGLLVKYEREFSEGRAKLEKLVYAARDHETAARKALAAVLVRRGTSLGADALETTKNIDPDLLLRFPNRVPPEAVECLTKAQVLHEIAGALDPNSNVLGAFHKATTELLGDVISEAAGFKPFGRPGHRALRAV